MNSQLKSAFRWHLQNPPRIIGRYGFEYQIGIRTITAVTLARADVAAGTSRYPAPVRQTYRSSEADGLRLVGRVVPESRRESLWDSRGQTGWNTEPSGDVWNDGTRLCYGVVYQLPGRKGESRFVAGFEFGGVDGGPDLDLTRVFVEPQNEYDQSPRGMDSAIEAARASDQLAKGAAETERDYQIAWRAGTDWANCADLINRDRAEVLALMAERKRAMRGAVLTMEAPAMCRMIKRELSRLIDRIKQTRSEMRDLAAGNSEDLIFWPGEARLQDAFCEGAGLSAYPKGV